MHIEAVLFGVPPTPSGAPLPCPGLEYCHEERAAIYMGLIFSGGTQQGTRMPPYVNLPRWTLHIAQDDSFARAGPSSSHLQLVCACALFCDYAIAWHVLEPSSKLLVRVTLC
ncbi:hypothetical protein EVAR_87485_1 [Eumeta japonica]|uniref:Uncharacterized protein n=1 Tax=Eumeta variegata TaxID=151549 RepID=A0A4C1VX25_EUMVA|nr:hypothetical protein EVAR_87485_1 [Eumeta japonica]